MRKYKGLRASRKKREKLSYVLLFIFLPFKINILWQSISGYLEDLVETE